MAENIFTRIGSLISKVAPTQTLGSSLSTTADLVGGAFELSDRKLNLIGSRRYNEFDRMVRDTAIVGAGVRLFLNLIANAVWTVNPPDDLNANEQPVAQGYADFVYNQIFGMTTSWTNVVRKAAGFRLLGFAILEWTAKRTDDGQLGLLDIEHRPQRTISRWIRDDGGTVEAVVQVVSGRGQVELPRSKIIYAVDDTVTDSPEGVGLYRHLYETDAKLQLFLELEEIGFTTDLRGVPIARAPLAELQNEVVSSGPQDSDGRKKAEAARQFKLKPLTDFITRHIRNKKMGALLASDTYNGKTADGAITPSTVPKWAIELLTGDSQSFPDIAKAIDRCNQEMARTMGVEHLLLGGNDRGSYALAQSKVGLFFQTITSTLQDLVEVFDRDIVKPLAELNGWPDELRPQFSVNEISDRDLDMVAGVLLKLAQAGASIMPDDPIVGEIRDSLGFSRPTEESIKMMLDASLAGNRGNPNAPNDPNAPAGAGNADMNQNPEDGMAKARVIRSRQRRLRRRVS